MVIQDFILKLNGESQEKQLKTVTRSLTILHFKTSLFIPPNCGGY